MIYLIYFSCFFSLSFLFLAVVTALFGNRNLASCIPGSPRLHDGVCAQAERQDTSGIRRNVVVRRISAFTFMCLRCSHSVHSTTETIHSCGEIMNNIRI